MNLMRGSLGFALALVTLLGARLEAQAEVWIDFTVTGTVNFAGREEEVVSCNETDEGMRIRAMGEWQFTFDVPSAAPGKHEAQVHVSAPASVTALHDDDPRTDDHLTGSATLTSTSAGAGRMGMPLLRVQFLARELTSGTGARIDVEGVLVCRVS
jgi:hypothetical protein